MSRWPTFQAQHARKATLKVFFQEHNVPYPNIIEAPRAIKTATPLTHDVSVITPHYISDDL